MATKIVHLNLEIGKISGLAGHEEGDPPRFEVEVDDFTFYGSIYDLVLLEQGQIRVHVHLKDIILITTK